MDGYRQCSKCGHLPAYYEPLVRVYMEPEDSGSQGGAWCMACLLDDAYNRSRTPRDTRGLARGEG